MRRLQFCFPFRFVHTHHVRRSHTLFDQFVLPIGVRSHTSEQLNWVNFTLSNAIELLIFFFVNLKIVWTENNRKNDQIGELLSGEKFDD